MEHTVSTSALSSAVTSYKEVKHQKCEERRNNVLSLHKANNLSPASGGIHIKHFNSDRQESVRATLARSTQKCKKRVATTLSQSQFTAFNYQAFLSNKQDGVCTTSAREAVEPQAVARRRTEIYTLKADNWQYARRGPSPSNPPHCAEQQHSEKQHWLHLPWSLV